jgi:hypothetical protein
MAWDLVRNQDKIAFKVKVLLFQCLVKHQAMKMYGEVEVYLHRFLILAQDGGV